MGYNKLSRLEETSFAKSVLILPREEPYLDDTLEPEESDAGGRAAFLRSPERSEKERSVAKTLTRVGLDEVRKTPGLMSSRADKLALTEEDRGVFATLDLLGATTAYLTSEAEWNNVQEKLEADFTIVPNFELSLPERVSLAESPEAIGRSAPSRREWPQESGVELAHDKGIRGAGVLVAVLDTGVDADHNEFRDEIINYRYVSFYPYSPYWPPRDVRGFDVDGHGTHVSGIIAGQSVGVAPEAALYSASVIESEKVTTSMIRVTYGLEWVLRQVTRPDNQHRPAVLNMSLGFPASPPSGVTEIEYQQRLSVMRRMVRYLMRANVLPVVAIGNSGPGTYGFPGAFRDAVGVGAVDFQKQVAEFSGDGDVPGEGLKPDLVGYGVGIYSSLERDYEGRSVYQRLSGTSMAAPYVTGIAALYRSYRPTLNAREIRDLLVDNALALESPRAGAGLARFVL